jgi:hypothetical protein
MINEPFNLKVLGLNFQLAKLTPTTFTYYMLDYFSLMVYHITSLSIKVRAKMIP